MREFTPKVGVNFDCLVRRKLNPDLGDPLVADRSKTPATLYPVATHAPHLVTFGAGTHERA
jgi:hypothetical protein